MYIGEQLFHSPYPDEGGDVNCYDVNWLHQAAVYCAEQPRMPRLPKMLKEHPQFKDHVQYIKAVNAAELSQKQLNRKFHLHHHVSRWVTDDYFVQKHYAARLDALLLSPAPLASLAVDTGVPEEVLKMYCAFFFDVRDSEFKHVRGELMRHIVALEGLAEVPARPPPAIRWKVMGASPLGYVMLSTTFGLSAGRGADNVDGMHWMGMRAQAALDTHYQSGSVSDRDSADVLARVQEQQKFEAEEGRASGDDQGWLLLGKLMSLTKPVLAQRKMDADALAANEKALESVRSATRTIEATAVEDAGPGAGMNDLHDKLRGQSRKARAVKEGE